ncbi:ComF family protein [Rhodohalobacter sp. 8-1]|uniref:ComF family protein n=1 Tax=Rhodohalobacter sp. 8-1 TaxID=3131972 RepID=UPI0030EBD91A
MKKYIKPLIEPVADLVFPPVCACCGDRVMVRLNMICDECLTSRFERATNNSDEILPESVSFRHSLWLFDKYGYLQDLLHKLKYDHCTGIGEQLGREAGRSLRSAAEIQNIDKWRLAAVPLHKKRYRKRGYNQSMEIARGVAAATGIDLLTEGYIKRLKNTKTQTGLNSDERTSNISGAFEVTQPSAVQNCNILIVDDVFTTGATTFELAQIINNLSGQHCGILTIAKA